MCSQSVNQVGNKTKWLMYEIDIKGVRRRLRTPVNLLRFCGLKRWCFLSADWFTSWQSHRRSFGTSFAHRDESGTQVAVVMPFGMATHDLPGYRRTA